MMEINKEEFTKQLFEELKNDEKSTKVEIYIPNIVTDKDMEAVAPAKLVETHSLISACFLLNELDEVKKQLIETYPEVVEGAKFIKEVVDKYTIYDEWKRTKED